MNDLTLSENRGIMSRVPSGHGAITIELEGPQIGTWALEHQHDNLEPFGCFIVASYPEFTVRCVGRVSVGPAQLDGRIVLKLPVDRAEFANTFEAAPIALERLSQLPDAKHLAGASLRIEIEANR